MKAAWNENVAILTRKGMEYSASLNILKFRLHIHVHVQMYVPS